MDTNVVIFFVGLTVFSNTIPNDCGVKAILPRVVYNSPTQLHQFHTSGELQYQVAQAGSAGRYDAIIRSPLRDYQHVEDHDAVIVFPTSSYHPSSNWGTPEVIKKSDGSNSAFSFVRLDGDLVRFISNDARSTSLPGVLPALKTMVCPAKMQSLRADYLPPYRGAAAVFELPQGILDSCMSTTSAGNDRLDTKLVLTSPGPYFVISASTMKTRKELRLKPNNGNVELLIANVPKRYLGGDTSEIATSAPNGMKHDNAYYAMGSIDTGSCNMTLTQWYQMMKVNNQLSVARCNFAGPNWKTDASAPGGILQNVMAASFECSNSQWP